MQQAGRMVASSSDPFGKEWGRIGHRLSGAGAALFVSFFILLILSHGSVSVEALLVLVALIYAGAVPVSLLLDWTIRQRFPTYPVVIAHGLAGLVMSVLFLLLMTSGVSVLQSPAAPLVMTLGLLAGATAALVGMHVQGSLAVATAVGAPALVVLTALTS